MKILFWCHLVAGIAAGAFVAFLAVTGSLLALEPQILQFAERRLLPGAAGGSSPCLSAGQLMLAVQTQLARPVGALELFADSRMPAQVQLGKEEMVFADPCTGRVLPGGAAQKVRAFLRGVRNLHESAALGHDRGGVMRHVKNAANVGFCFLILSGLVLWVPKRWHRASVRAVMVPRLNLHGRALDWNLHNVAGFWLAVPLLAISATGVLMSYSWGDGKRNGKEHVRQENNGHPDALTRALAPSELLAIDGPVATASKLTPGWRSLRLRLDGPSGQTVSFAFNDGDAGSGEKGKRPQLRIDRVSGRILEGAPGERSSLRAYARVLHTGQAFGLTGQIVALLASLAALLLVWTGFALTTRRFNAWRRRRSASAAAKYMELPMAPKREA
jgi:uncharacterized iron-regulated membrane protein